jgi:hypothetical protein
MLHDAGEQGSNAGDPVEGVLLASPRRRVAARPREKDAEIHIPDFWHFLVSHEND